MITKWWISESSDIFGEQSGLWSFIWDLTERFDWFSEERESEHDLGISTYSPCLIRVATQIISWNSRFLSKIQGLWTNKIPIFHDNWSAQTQESKNSEICEFSKLMIFYRTKLVRTRSQILLINSRFSRLFFRLNTHIPGCRDFFYIFIKLKVFFKVKGFQGWVATLLIVWGRG